MSEGLTNMRQMTWTKLQEGVADAASPARYLVLATCAQTGAAARLVVLRDADQSNAALTFFTHAASKKVSELSRDPRAEIVLWDPVDLFQVRFAVTVGMKAVTQEVWNSFGPNTRLNYADAPSPGEQLADPDTYAPIPDRRHCVVLTASIQSVDVLSLAHTPHRRAVFERKDSFTGSWIAP